MDIRYKGFLIHEAGAVHRQEMARTAQSVAHGMSDSAGLNKFITHLELFESKAESEGDEKLVADAINALRR